MSLLKIWKRIKIVYYKPILFYNNIKKLIFLLDKTYITNNGSIIIDLPQHLVVKTKGSLISYTTDGYHIHAAKQTYINPKIKKIIPFYLDETYETIDKKQHMLVYALKKEVKKELERKHIEELECHKK